jgi:hypothetical protein
LRGAMQGVPAPPKTNGRDVRARKGRPGRPASPPGSRPAGRRHRPPARCRGRRGGSCRPPGENELRHPDQESGGTGGGSESCQHQGAPPLAHAGHREPALRCCRSHAPRQAATGPCPAGRPKKSVSIITSNSITAIRLASAMREPWQALCQRFGLAAKRAARGVAGHGKAACPGILQGRCRTRAGFRTVRLPERSRQAVAACGRRTDRLGARSSIDLAAQTRRFGSRSWSLCRSSWNMSAARSDGRNGPGAARSRGGAER